MLRRNDIFEMTCENFGQDAQGVCRHDGMAVFVPGMLPGERAMVRIVKPEKRYAFGRIEQLLQAAPERTKPFCPIYKRCGGCSCQHMTYETSLRFKQDQVQQLLSRVGGLDITVPPVLGMDEPFAYRNKGAYPVGEIKGGPACGFFAPRSHDLIALPEQGCAIQRADANDATRVVLDWMKQTGARAYDEITGKGLVRHIMTRSTQAGGLMVVLVVTQCSIPRKDLLIDLLRKAVPGLVSLCLSINSRRTNVILGEEIHVLWGEGVMEDTLHGLKFSVSPLSFFQVNPVQTEKLYQLALDYAQLSGDETVVDAYCGAGTISLMLARKAKKVIGIEIVEPAIENANANAARNGITNAEFIVGATEDVLPRLVAGGMRPDVIVVDPPRKGCEEAVLQAILESQPERVVYVSCGAPTLARDAKILAEGGYRAEKVQCVDMFCWTGAVETVILLSRKDVYERIKFDVNVEDLQGRASSTATYSEIKAYILEKFGLKVSSLYIAQIKDKCGFEKRDNYNIGEGKSKELICPPDKEAAIMDAFRHFGMLRD